MDTGHREGKLKEDQITHEDVYTVLPMLQDNKNNSLKVKTKREIKTAGLKRHRFSAKIHNIKKSPRKKMLLMRIEPVPAQWEVKRSD